MAEATTRAPNLRSGEDLTAYLIELPAVREQLEARRKEIEVTRRAHVKALAAAQKRRADAGALGAAFERAQAEEVAAERALQAARNARVMAFQAITAHTMQCDVDMRRAEAELRETADPRIGTFLEWCYAELWDERKAGFSSATQPNGRNPLTGKERPATFYSNREKWERRIAALEAAVPQAEALRFVVEADVEKQLEALRASIPARDLTTERDGTVDPALVSFAEPPDDDKRPTFTDRVLAARYGQ